MFIKPDDMARLDAMMNRCDRAVGLVRENRLNRKDADELVRATLNLIGEIRLIRNTARLHAEPL